ncbi:MAG: thiamine phosphate synthase, partial [Proteobacteria bacterium]|nr:thiamine phosphate synthase [Pseudomonadota bacterium]
MRADPRLHGLYVITDKELCASIGIVDSVAAAIDGGARIFQYRDKSVDHERRLREACALVELCNAHDAILLVNDDVSLAREAKAHGVHLGSEDESITTAREKLGSHAIIGVSCYSHFSLAEEAAKAGTDYVA